MRVGVTGATGFIGGALVARLDRAGYELTLVDDGSGPVQVVYPEHPVLRASFASAEGLRALEACDVVLHLGAVSGVMACAGDPAGTAAVNVGGTRTLVDRCAERGVPLAFASSFSVVGSPERLPVTEATPARPTHEYARQKAEGERLVAAPGREGRLPTVVLRMSNVYGGYEAGGTRVTKPNVLQLFLAQAKEGVLRVNAPGTQRRDFVHLEDVLGHWEAAIGWLDRRRSEHCTATFNVASGETHSVGEVAELLRARWMERFPGAPAPRVEVVTNPRAGVELVDPEFQVSRERTERELGVRCQHTVDGFLAEALKALPAAPAAARDLSSESEPLARASTGRR